MYFAAKVHFLFKSFVDYNIFSTLDHENVGLSYILTAKQFIIFLNLIGI